MKPILFAKDATTFTTNGLGRLDCISCEVIEERNGQYILDMVVPEDALHAKEIEMSSIIVAKPSQNGTNQPFRVYKITKPFGGRFEVFAEHISYQLSYIPVMPFTVLASSGAANDTLQGLKSHSAESNPFTFWTNVNTIASYKQDIPASVRQRLGGIEGSVLDQFGGEYEWDGYTVKLWKNRGVTLPTVSLRYGKNITDIQQEEYISETITGICPYWMDSESGEVVTLTEKVVESEYADDYPFKRTVTVDFSEQFEVAPTQLELKAAAEDYLDKEGIGVPTVSIKVSFVNLADTEEYKELAPLQTVKLCDRIIVEFEKLGISTTAKIVKTEYDVLAERYKSIEIGSVKTSLAQTISDTNTAITTTMDKALFSIKNATSWITGNNGYVKAVKNTDGTWKELLFMDTDDAETAVNVLRINENGIGFSRNGINGPYTQAWTLDGRLVVGGTNVPSISVMYNDIEVAKIDKTGILWNNPDTENPTFKFVGDRLRMYAWDTNDGRVTGELVTMKAVVNGVTERTLSLLGVCDSDDSVNQTGIGFYLKVNNSNKTIFQYDHSDYDRGDTPYIINTSSGTLFPDNPNGGITIQNGLVKNWNLRTHTGTIFENAGGGITVKNGLVTGVGTLGGSSTEGDSPDQTIIGFTIRDGLITGLSKASQVYSGYFTAGSLRIYVTGGKITKVENI